MLLRGSAGVERQWGGVNPAEQSLCAAEQREAAARVCAAEWEGRRAPRGQFKGRAEILGRRAQGKAGEHLGGDRGVRLREEGEDADARDRARDRKSVV